MTNGKLLTYDEAMEPVRAAWEQDADPEIGELRAELQTANMLRAARLALGLTQQQAARLTGEDQGDISKFESGKLDPRFSRAQRYLDALRAAAESGKAAVLAAKPALSAWQAAQYLLEIQDQAAAITNLKLQKLLYYGQGYSLAICDQRLFVERIKRWDHGPVVPQVWKAYTDNGAGLIPRPDDFDPLDVDPKARLVLERVAEGLGQMTAGQLVDRTHAERPWVETKPNAEIPVDLIADFFKGELAAGRLP